MGNFYGNILKHFQEAFSSFSFRNENGKNIDITAQNTKSRIIFSADPWINATKEKVEDGNDPIIKITHGSANTNINNETTKMEILSSSTGDISLEGAQLKLTSQYCDEKGHLNGNSSAIKIPININTEKKKREEQGNQISNLERINHFKGVFKVIPQDTQKYKDGDIISIENADNHTFKDYVLYNGEWTQPENLVELKSLKKQFSTVKIPEFPKEDEKVTEYNVHSTTFNAAKDYADRLALGPSGESGIIGNLRNQVNINTKDIAALTAEDGPITKNTANIKTHESQIQMNTSSIEALTSESGPITRNTTNIVAHEAQIRTNTKKIAALTAIKDTDKGVEDGPVTKNTNNIKIIMGDEKQEGSIKKAVNDLVIGRVAANTSNISKNTIAIEAINNAESGILASSKAYVDQLANGSVKTNTNNIAINTRNIAALTAENGPITKNTADIEALKQKTLIFSVETIGVSEDIPKKSVLKINFEDIHHTKDV